MFRVPGKGREILLALEYHQESMGEALSQHLQAFNVLTPDSTNRNFLIFNAIGTEDIPKKRKEKGKP